MIQKRTTEPSKNSVHAPWIHAAGILTALWLMIVFLITAVEAVAYWTPGYYKMEYEKYQVLDDLPEMTMDDLLSVTDEMMAYLRGNREDLHVFTTMGGEYREFFNARENRPHGGRAGAVPGRPVAQTDRTYVYPGLCRSFIFLETGP